MSVVVALGLLGLFAGSAQQQATIPEEDYSFLDVTAGPCLPKTGSGIEPAREAECRQMTEPRRYRGTWYVAFETSSFTRFGKRSCIETQKLDCADLDGSVLPWPSRWACPRIYELDFIGRRNALPGFYLGTAYRIVVEQVISAKRLSDPSNEGDCDPAAP